MDQALPPLGIDFPLLNFEYGSPISDDFSLLATPIASGPTHDTTRIGSPFARYTTDSIIDAPAAPIMRDMDSFADGTSAGSFAGLDDDDEDYNPDALLVAHPYPSDFSTQADRRIHAWLRNLPSNKAPLLPYADLPDDPIQTAALESTQASLGEFAIDIDEELEEVESVDDINNSISGGNDTRKAPPSNVVPPMSTPIAMTPRVMKRARSPSPASQTSRRPRPKSFPGLPSDITILPPWRSTYPFKD